MSKKVAIIGSGFSGLSTASILAKEGVDVTIFEKHDAVGGRARQFSESGFTFDMGPSWYWMPEVMEKFFSLFGEASADHFDLVRLDPSYRVFWEDGDFNDVPSSENNLMELFETLEPGSSKHLKKFLAEAEYKYKVGIEDLVYKPGLSLTDYMDKKVISGVFKLNIFQSHAKYVRKFFKNEKLIRLLEFPVLFLGAMPERIPALYSLMNYADLKLGTWYPMGGMHKLVEGMTSVAQKQGVKIELGKNVEKINVVNGNSSELCFENERLLFDAIVGSADYHHIDTKLLSEKYRNYTDKYWETRSMAPSCLIYYMGVNKKIEGLQHHNLFFDTSFKKHAEELYTDVKWPSNPLFYVCNPSKTDPSVAPEGKENIFILIPVAPGLEDTVSIRNTYRDLVIKRLESILETQIEPYIEYERSYAPSNFRSDYNAFKGNAYGLANTLKQTGVLKPRLKNKKVKNLYYTGQLTVPGPGVPPSIISGQVVASQLLKDLNK